MANLPPQMQVLALARSYVEPRALYVIAELGAADVLGDTPMSAEALAEAVNANADALNRLLRVLVSRGIFEARGNGYAHNDASRTLRADHPRSTRPFVMMIGSRINWQAMEELGHSARTGQTAMEKVFGESQFPYLSKHPEQSAIFNAAMTAKAMADIPALLEAYDFGPFATVADIGGGRGHLLRAILDKVPSAQGILFDLPHVVVEASSIASNRLELQGGNFFADPLPRADAYLLWNVLHDWPDADCIAIIAAIRQAAPLSAKLLILETILPAGPEPSPVKDLDIVMLAMNGGRERTHDEYAAILTRAALHLDRVLTTATGLNILEASPA